MCEISIAIDILPLDLVFEVFMVDPAILLRFHQVSLSIGAGGWAGRIAGYNFEEDPATGCRIDAEGLAWCGDTYVAGRPIYQIFRAIDVIFCGSRN